MGNYPKIIKIIDYKIIRLIKITIDLVIFMTFYWDQINHYNLVFLIQIYLVKFKQSLMFLYVKILNQDFSSLTSKLNFLLTTF